MEEILASIRRIIAEDGEAPAAEEGEPGPGLEAAAEPAPQPEEEVLELTDIVGEEEPATPPISSAALLKATDEEAPPEPKRATVGRLVSDAVAASSSAAFASIINRPRRRGTGDIPMGNSAATLEEMVREIVTPILKEWLDANLAIVVERIVKEEVQRLSRDAL